MACQRCNYSDWSKLPDGTYQCTACGQTYYIQSGRTSIKSHPPAVTPAPCPGCEAAARERDALHALCDRLNALLTAVAVALRGPEPPLTIYGWADLPERAESVVRELAPLRERIEALCREMETDDRAGKLAHWVAALRDLLAETEAE